MPFLNYHSNTNHYVDNKTFQLQAKGNDAGLLACQHTDEASHMIKLPLDCSKNKNWG